MKVIHFQMIAQGFVQPAHLVRTMNQISLQSFEKSVISKLSPDCLMQIVLQKS